MTRKDYIRAVAIVRAPKLVGTQETTQATIDAFIDFFQEDNPRFDPERFRKACEKPLE